MAMGEPLKKERLRWCQEQYESIKQVQGTKAPRGIKLAKMESRDDPETFLEAFEHEAKCARWPKEVWPKCLAPFLSAEAQSCYQALPISIAEDYDQLKQALLEHLGLDDERYQKQFRSLTLGAGVRPLSVASQLQDLGHRWLKPDIRSATEIVELIIMEQFVQILPAEAREWLSHHHVRSLARAVRLIEGYLAQQDVHPISGPPDCPQELLSDEIVIVKAEETSDLDEGVEDSPVWIHLDSEESGKSQSMARGTTYQGRNCDKFTTELQSSLSGKGTDSMFEDSELEKRNNILIGSQVKPRRQEQNILYELSDYETDINKSISSNTKNTTSTGKKVFYKCVACGKIFRQLIKLITHERIHSGEKHFFCAMCGKSFSDPAAMNKHQRMHTGGKPYACDTCGKSFNQSSHLTIHKRTHTGEKPYACTECGKGFTDSSSLKKHIRIHTGQKPYVCQGCGKGFSDSSNLTKHMKIHSGLIVTKERNGQRQQKLQNRHQVVITLDD
ncbi:zinc finger and SCAN domain-containing protein 26-like [Lissotriton helveticus]